MNDFKTTYRNAVSDIENVHIDLDSVLDEGRRKRFKAHRKRQKLFTAAAAGGIFILCTLGTSQAAEYVKTVIKANEYGFWSGDMLTMSRNTSGQKEAGDEEHALAGSMAGAEWEEELADTLKMEEDELVIESTEGETREYTSIEDFREKEDAVFVLPDLEGMGYMADSERIWVNGSYISAQLTFGEKYLIFDRIDYSETKTGHASSTVFMGGVCNERTYITGRGYEYLLVDSKEKTEEGQLVIHAAVSVGYYEIYVDFFGFSEEEMQQILEQMDLSYYEPGKK